MILYLTDMPEQAQRLVVQTPQLKSCVMIDLLDPYQKLGATVDGSISAVVTDASLAHAATITTVRRYLDPLKCAGVPFICLLHEDTPRNRAQAQALGAMPVLRADEIGRIAAALPPSSGPPCLETNLKRAERSLVHVLKLGRVGNAIPPDLIETGAGYVEGALRQGGIRAWLEQVWRFDDVTHQHCLLVAGLAAGFAQRLGLRRSDCQRLTAAALLHDVGKSRLPLAILNKPGKLTAEERAVIETHPVIGYELLVGQDYSAETLAVVRSHHECLDGSGYPDQLIGSEIADLVRLVTICDIYAALIERRPYKAPMSAERAMGILDDMGGKLDRDLVRAFRPISVQANRREEVPA